MKVKELKSGQGKVDVLVEVKTKGEVRTINKYGKDLRLCNCLVGDDSGEISLTLWNEDCDKVNQGSTVKITNGYVSEFNGKLQLTSGKFGKLEVVGADSSSGSSVSVDKKSAKKTKAEEVSEEDMI
jgi:replication factor A1